MDFEAIRLTIRQRLEKGLLPMERAARVLGRSPSGEACDGCDRTIERGQLAIGGFAHEPGRRALQLHLRCFEIWAQERSSLEMTRARYAAPPPRLGRLPA